MTKNLLAVLLIFSLLGAGQQPAAPVRPETTIRANTSMVIVDVVATDTSGKPVKDLTAKDFTVLEDGRPQTLASCTLQGTAEPQPNGSAPAKPRPVLPANLASNVPEYRRPEGAVLVLLLDALNTSARDQVYVRQQMLQALAENHDPHMRMAIVALTNNLIMLQDFTTDPVLLEKALRAYRVGTAAAARDKLPDMPSRDANRPTTNSSRGPEMPPEGSLDPEDAWSAQVDSTRRFAKEQTAQQTEIRIEKTLDALQAISSYVSAFQGRKILLWFSGSFPFTLYPTQREDITVTRVFTKRVQETTNRLADAQIAVYAIDARGLTTPAVADLQQGQFKGVLGTSVNAQFAHDEFARLSSEGVLEDVAGDTGGRAFLNSNDLGRALKAAIEDAGSYYTLAYYPANKKWDGRFRAVKVTSRDGVRLRYRRGYYATNPAEWRRAGGHRDMKVALERDPLASTDVLFYARASAVTAGNDFDVNVDFLVDPRTISFEKTKEERQHSDLTFEVQAFTPEGKPLKAEVQQAQGDLEQKTYERVQQQGLPMRVTIRLPAGFYSLRFGVRDNRTSLFGTSGMLIHTGTEAKK